MKKIMILVGAVLCLATFGISRAANLTNVSNYNKVEAAEGIYLGDAQDIAAVTMPTSTNDRGYSIKVPFYNGSPSATAVGTVILASTTATSNIYGTYAAILATTSVLGVSDGIYASGSKGWMAIAGYCQVLTTGTVNVGDILVSTGGSSGTGAAGYAGTTTGTQVVGTAIGKALSPGTAAGGLTTILLTRP
jgi:hypothetical protein